MKYDPINDDNVGREYLFVSAGLFLSIIRPRFRCALCGVRFDEESSKNSHTMISESMPDADGRVMLAALSICGRHGGAMPDDAEAVLNDALARGDAFSSQPATREELLASALILSDEATCEENGGKPVLRRLRSWENVGGMWTGANKDALGMVTVRASPGKYERRLTLVPWQESDPPDTYNGGRLASDCLALSRSGEKGRTEALVINGHMILSTHDAELMRQLGAEYTKA